MSQNHDSMLRASILTGATNEKNIEGNVSMGPNCSSGMQSRVDYTPNQMLTYNAGMNFTHSYNIPQRTGHNVPFNAMTGRILIPNYYLFQPNRLEMTSMSTVIREINAENNPTTPAFGNEITSPTYRHGVWRKTSDFPFEIRNPSKETHGDFNDIRDIRGQRRAIRVVFDRRSHQRGCPYTRRERTANRGANACEFGALQTIKADSVESDTEAEKLEKPSALTSEYNASPLEGTSDDTEVDIDVVGFSDEELQ